MSIIRGLLAQAAKQAKGVGQTALQDARDIDNAAGFVAGVRPSTVGLAWTDMLHLTHGNFKPGSARAREADNVGLLLSGVPRTGVTGDLLRSTAVKHQITQHELRRGVPAHAMGIVNDYQLLPLERAKALGVSGANIRTVLGIQKSPAGGHSVMQLSQPVDKLLGNIRAMGGRKVSVVDPGGKAWGDAIGGPTADKSAFTRHPVLISPKGRVFISARPGYHHDDVAMAAGLPKDWPKKGYFQADLHQGIPEEAIPDRLQLGGWMDSPPTRGHAYGVARLKNALKNAGSSITTYHGAH